MKMYLSNRNTKLGKEIYSFSISLKSCRHKTVECKKYCYAKRGTFNFPSVKKGIEDNYRFTKEKEFENRINAELSFLKEAEDIKLVRIHACGDFYSQEYYNKWERIAKKNKTLIFLAYTRNYDIDCSKRPDNFKMYFSCDKSTIRFNDTIQSRAYVFDKDEVVQRPVCKSKCFKCKFCFTVNKDINFRRR